MLPDVLELGLGYSARFATYKDSGIVVTAIVTGPAGGCCKHAHWDDKTLCTGALSVEGAPPELVRKQDGSMRPIWLCSSVEPLTLSPSIRCSCDVDEAGVGQHGFITAGRWVNAGGIVVPGS